MTRDGPGLARIAVHPIKSLDPVERAQARLVENGGLEHDRAYAILDEDGEYVNGKRTPAVHRIRSSFGDALETVTLRREETAPGNGERFHIEADRAELDTWLSEYFGFPVHLEQDTRGGFPDDRTLSGPTLISTATLRAVASWYDGIDTHGMRLRVRANLEIEGVPPFWEDRLFAGQGEAVAFRIGDVEFQGVNPCKRCVVPERDPHTGAAYENFRGIFVENRRETFPEWADRDRFDHYFRLMVNTAVEPSEWGSGVEAGDDLRVLGHREFEPGD
jgi:uncharacterized protein YcbX